MAEYVNEPYPARTTIPVGNGGSDVKIDAVLFVHRRQLRGRPSRRWTRPAARESLGRDVAGNGFDVECGLYRFLYVGEHWAELLRGCRSRGPCASSVASDYLRSFGWSWHWCAHGTSLETVRGS